jgi:Lon protease-like protein
LIIDPMQIPLFPLHTVLAPGIALPLHIFEDRYRVMVQRCLDTSTPFGVVLIRDGSEVAPRDGTTAELAIAGVGTVAEIREANKYADGRWDILIVGRVRFVIHEVIADTAPYLLAEVDLLPDEPGDDEATEVLTRVVTRRFVDYLRLLQPRDGENVEPIDVQMEVEVEDEGDDDDDDGDADDDDEVDDEVDDIVLRLLGSAALIDPPLMPDPQPLPVDDPEATRAALRIPEDPSALSFLLTGIVQVEPDRKQALLEATSAEERLRDINELLDREIDLLGRRLAPYSFDRRALTGSAN